MGDVDRVTARPTRRFAISPVFLRHTILRRDDPNSFVDSIRLVPFLIVPVHRNGGKKLNTAKILQERIRSAFAPAANSAVKSPDRNELARSSDACLNLDLGQRIAAIRSIASGRIVFTTSFGIEDQAITHAICSQALAIDLVTLDTGRLFPQTYELWTRTERRYGRRIQAFYPDCAAVEALVGRQGINGFYGSVEARHACCAVRKLEPLRRALARATAWITGLRADQSDDRAAISFAAIDPQLRLIKVNPLFDWTRDQVLTFIREHGIPYSPLHDQGFLSIGCVPCTRAVVPGEQERAGRWWWEKEQKKECGLHHRHHPQAPTQSEASLEEATP
jgi:phosphoadenosine phosphosulfate reductase